MRRSCQLTIAIVILGLALFPPFHLPRQVVAILPTSTNAVGTSPSAYGSIIAFTTDEVKIQADLNGDGDRLDRVIRYYDVVSGTLTNTRALGDFPSVYESLIVSTMPNGTITIFNITSSNLINTGVRGEGARVWGDSVAFTGLGPGFSQKVGIYHLSTRLTENTGAFGSYPSLHGRILAFSTSEAQVNSDLNGDGTIDPFTSVARYYDTTSRTVVNTGALADKVSAYGSIIGFDYAQNAPIRFYNTTSGVTGDTGTVGLAPVVYGDLIFMENGTIRKYQLSTGTSEDTRIDGNAVTAYQNLVAFETDENIVNKDLNGDHQIKDVVIRFFELPYHDVAVSSSTPSGTDMNQPPITLTATITNPGDSTQTFSLTFLWNSTDISVVSGITLGSKTSTSVSVQWSTGSLLPGAYVLSARASVVSGESETVNNLFVDGTLVKPAPAPIGTGAGGGSSPRAR